MFVYRKKLKTYSHVNKKFVVFIKLLNMCRKFNQIAENSIMSLCRIYSTSLNFPAQTNKKQTAQLKKRLNT